ncbi:MAG: ATP-dependent helicase (plasmid) [Nitrospira sp.]
MMLMSPEAWRPHGIDDLEPRAWEALRETSQSVCVTAGAGSGKTEFLAQKATYLLQTGLCRDPKRILAISFKRDAAYNLADRVARRCPPEQARRLDSFTFDAFTKGLLDRFRLAIPEFLRPPLDYQIVFHQRRDYEQFLERHGFYGLQAGELESALATTRLPLNENEGTGGVYAAVTAYWREQYRNPAGVGLTFAMINRLVELVLRIHPGIRGAFQMTYPFIFLDEFQDTTSAQFQLLTTALDGSDSVLTAVGDDKQRIMGWAGAMPDGFSQFETTFSAGRVQLLSNWRSHEDLVRIQHVIACRIDPESECPEARAEREVHGDVAAIWEFGDPEAERSRLADWIAEEVESGNVEPHDIAILVRSHADRAEEDLAPALARRGIRLRNTARFVGDIDIQSLLGEELTAILMPLLRLGAKMRSPEDWDRAQQTIQFLESLDPDDGPDQEQLQTRLGDFVRALRRSMREVDLNPDSASEMVRRVLDFVGVSLVRQNIPAYRRQHDFERVWNGFVALLRECAQGASSWDEVLNEFEGVGQVVLMTIHKSKGLEFHTMIFYGLDNQTWWSLTPNQREELNSFFVAFTRAKQRAFFTFCSERGQPIAWIENLLAPAGLRRIQRGTD